MDLSGKRALVTGSTRGIGYAIASRLARAGAAVAVTGRTEVQGRAVTQEISDAGGRAMFVQMDVSDEASVQAAIDAIEQEFGGLDILVNNAAPTELVPNQAPVGEMSTETWDALIKTGLYGVFWCTKYGVQAIARSGGGVIVNISSGQATRGLPAMGAYSATKGAIEALTRQVAVDYAPKGIRCNAVAVGFVDSNQLTANLLANEPIRKAIEATQLTRIGQPSDIAAVVNFLVSDDAEYLTGTTIFADGGFTARGAIPDMTAAMGGAEVHG